MAVFERSFYVQCKSGIFCVAIRSLSKGPLNVLVASDEIDFLKIVSTGMLIDLPLRSLSCVHNQNQSGNGLLIARSMKIYSGDVPRIQLAHSSVTLLKKIHRSIKPTNTDGFGWIMGVIDWQTSAPLVNPAYAGYNAVEKELRKLGIQAISTLYTWLLDPLNDKSDPSQNQSTRQFRFTELLGAGPGLTPAGDDLLAGVLLALHYADHSNIAGNLWKVLEPQVNSRTNAISAAHLRLSANGQCAQPVLHLLDGLLSGSSQSNSSTGSERSRHGRYCETTDEAVQLRRTAICRLADSIGSSSGWDILAGITLVVSAL